MEPFFAKRIIQHQKLPSSPKIPQETGRKSKVSDGLFRFFLTDLWITILISYLEKLIIIRTLFRSLFDKLWIGSFKNKRVALSNFQIKYFLRLENKIIFITYEKIWPFKFTWYLLLCKITSTTVFSTNEFHSSCTVSKPPNLPGWDWQEKEAAKPDIVTGSVWRNNLFTSGQ